MLLTREQLVDTLQPTPLFADLSAGEISGIVASLSQIKLARGEVIIEEGASADSMYIVLSGHLSVQTASIDQVIDSVSAGGIVGEMGILTDQKRTATVTATEETVVLECNRRQLEHLFETAPVIVQRFQEVILPRIRRLYLVSALRDLIGETTYEEFQNIEAQLDWLHLRRDDVLFSAGEKQEEMYILVQGRLNVLNDEGEVVGEIEAGDTIGEEGLLGDTRRATTVKALRDSHLVLVDRGDFDYLAKNYPHISTNIARTIIKRQQALLTPQKTQRPDSLTFTLVPLDDNVDVVHLAEKLQSEMTHLGTARTFDSDQFTATYGYANAAQLPADHPIGIIVKGWMSQVEAETRYVIYIADSSFSHWTQRCIEASDRVLLVGSGDGSPTLTPTEESILERYPQVRRELILVHPENTDIPSGTANWLDVRDVKWHHHIRKNDTKHYRRTVRRLTGYATGLVFSGGGARGYVQLGVVRALEEAGVEIDMVAGTSIGAMLSAAYVLRGDFAGTYALTQQVSDNKLIFDYTFPLVALNNSTRVSKLLHKIYGDVNIEDMWIPYFNVASNMTKADIVVNSRGKLHKAIRGSMSIPGVFSPVVRDGDLIIDGGIVNNFPIDIMAEWCEGGTVIGLTAQSVRGGKNPRPFDIDDGVPGWRVLLSRFNPFGKSMRVPLLPITLLKTLEINTLRQQREYQHVADFILNVDTQDFDLLAFDDYERITQAGYDHAKPVIEEWVKTQPDYVTTD